MLAHQMAAAHKTAMQFVVDAREELLRYRNTGFKYPQASVEAARMATTAAKPWICGEGGRTVTGGHRVSSTDGWTGEDWQAFFEERAAIAEFDGGLSRTQAEAQAFECCVVEWLSRNPGRSTPGRCLSCGSGERLNDPLLPFAAKITGAAWLHSLCWEAWSEKRRAEAIRSLSAVGIVESQGQTDRADRGHR
jgi:hypothetical protein